MSLRLGIRPLLGDVSEGFRSQPGRVGLSFLAVAVGIAALTLLLAVLGGLRQRSRALIRELGANVIAILPETEESVGPGYLSDRQVALLEANLPGCVVTSVRGVNVSMRGVEGNLVVLATDHRLAAVRGWEVRSGRFLDRRDIELGERCAVVSGALCENLHVRVGSVIELADIPFRIVGVVDVAGGAIETEGSDKRLLVGEQVVIIPHTAPAWFRGWAPEAARAVHAIFVQVPAGEEVHDALVTAQRLLGTPDLAGGRNISWLTPELLIQRVRRLQDAVRVAGGSIAFLCLVLGGTTLMSLMVANVRDRIMEIGLRRALGATRLDIAMLFVVEAGMVTLGAGVVGTAAGGILVAVARSHFGATLYLGWFSVLLPLVVALLLGAAFAYWPARMAAQISPAEALRNE